jgi:hypothetical protein
MAPEWLLASAGLCWRKGVGGYNAKSGHRLGDLASANTRLAYLMRAVTPGAEPRGIAV